MNDVQPQRNSPDWEKLLDKPRIYVDLSSGGRNGASFIAPLNSSATITGIQRHDITLEEGLVLDLWTDDGDEDGRPDPLIFAGVIHFDEGLEQWVAIVNWDGFQHASEKKLQKDLEITVMKGGHIAPRGKSSSSKSKILS